MPRDEILTYLKTLQSQINIEMSQLENHINSLCDDADGFEDMAIADEDMLTLHWTHEGLEHVISYIQTQPEKESE